MKLYVQVARASLIRVTLASIVVFSALWLLYYNLYLSVIAGYHSKSGDKRVFTAGASRWN